MPTVPDLEYWTTAPAVTHDRPLGRVNPLAFLNPGECGAWVATLQALRALPSTPVAPPRRSGVAAEDAQRSASIGTEADVRVPGLDDACGA
jgi:hypothetical protein